MGGGENGLPAFLFLVSIIMATRNVLTCRVASNRRENTGMVSLHRVNSLYDTQQDICYVVPARRWVWGGRCIL
ncbi:hypothetical protein K504DRAFT_462533 [Pleomassaria siparia CBS 279.74]|uniref:Uncharacterized protein n=1 Tax=Pleomassaria siparia CBS 279.74 TaxID=1314801 RepID=A0A6G1KN82_9PLEO|nr:hypothetical protein K504DRAFT_462533 [Pleomassaria siparia CBS 279.74]